MEQDGLRINRSIRATEVRLIDESGQNLGIFSLSSALENANRVDLDLVEIAPDSTPPVCKIMDYGKYKYHEQKRLSAVRKNRKVIDVKEIKIRPNIDIHDYNIKLKSMERFLADGNRVKVTLRFRGRELAYQQQGMDVLKRIMEDMAEVARVEHMPTMEGRQAVMIMVPLS